MEPFTFWIRLILCAVLMVLGLWVLIVGAGPGPNVLGVPIVVIAFFLLLV